LLKILTTLNRKTKTCIEDRFVIVYINIHISPNTKINNNSTLSQTSAYFHKGE
jgi:hypothetical protein